MVSKGEWSARVQELFLAALEIERGGRRQFLEQSCGRDTPLLREVESLLAHAADSPDRVDPPTGGIARQVFELRPGERVQSYVIERAIGLGSTADVYAARMEAGAGRVALKFLRPDSDRQVADRFRSESIALARLSHPNIARVIEAGETEDGLAFIAMELLEGRGITETSDALLLSIPDRMSLYLQLCDAIEHLHGAGLVHRDIKPANTIVEEEPGGRRLRVIDFGIAKAPPSTPESAGPTVTGSVLGTLEYSSPEQLVDSKRVDGRADIYALGVVLYELLVGRRPFRVRDSAGMSAFLERVATDAPAAPGAVLAADPARAAAVARLRGTSVAELESVLRARFDAIVLRALGKAPADRHADVAELRSAVRAALAGLPPAGPASG